MNILIVANHYAVASGRYMCGAFRRLGHDARSIGAARGSDIWGLRLPAWTAWHPSSVDGFAPDVVVVMDSDPAVLDSAADIRSQFGDDVPIVVYGVDNHVRDYRRDAFDHYFLAHRLVSLQPFDERTTWLPCAYDPVVFKPSTVPYSERAYDVAMLGVMYPQRWQLVERLKAAGVKVIAGAGLVFHQNAQAYQNARISLCISAAGDVGQRVFETAACGCVVMSDACADFTLLKPRGLWTYEPDAVVDDVRSILADEATAQTQIQASKTWVQAHTWEARAQSIVDWMNA